MPDTAPGLVFRLDVYVGERDSHGTGYSDDLVFRKQYYVQAFPGQQMALFVHTGEEYLSPKNPKTRDELVALAEPGAGALVQRATQAAPGSNGADQWTFEVGGTGFTGVFRLAIERDDD